MNSVIDVNGLTAGLQLDILSPLCWWGRNVYIDPNPEMYCLSTIFQVDQVTLYLNKLSLPFIKLRNFIILAILSFCLFSSLYQTNLPFENILENACRITSVVTWLVKLLPLGIFHDAKKLFLSEQAGRAQIQDFACKNAANVLSLSNLVMGLSSILCTLNG